jgi:hypothetical protein
MAQKKYRSFDEFLNENPSLRVNPKKGRKSKSGKGRKNDPYLLLNSKEVSEEDLKRLARSEKDIIRQLEVDTHWGRDPVTGKWKLFADVPNEHTAARTATRVKKRSWKRDANRGKTIEAANKEANILLGDIPMDYKRKGMPGNPKDFRPISPEQKKQSKIVKDVLERRRADLLNHERLFIQQQPLLSQDLFNHLKLYQQNIPENISTKHFRAIINSVPMLEGMGGMDELFNSDLINQAKRAAFSLEAFPDGFATPPDEMTRVSVAEGRSRILGPGKTPLQQTPMDDYNRWLMGLHVDDLNKPIYSFPTTKADLFRARKIEESRLAHEDYINKIRHGEAVSNYFNDLQLEANKAERAEAIRLEKEAQRQQRIQQRQIGDMNYDYMNRYRATIAQAQVQEQEISRAVASSRAARASSSMADTIANDTMRAASVIHSSKLGFAAIGAGAIGAAFGIQSLRNRQEDQRRSLRG